MRDIFERVLQEYPVALNAEITEHPLAIFLRHDAPEEIRALVDDDAFVVKGSCGQGRWAPVPWIAVMENLVTTTTQNGYYVVYLFSVDMESVYLSLAQGVTAVKNEFKRDRNKILLQRAELIRTRIPAFKKRFKAGPIDLKATTGLGKDYETSTAFAKRYRSDNLPDAAQLEDDLMHMINLYKLLIFEGGVDLVESPADVDGEETMEIEERKRYREHKRIEGRINTDKVKDVHGYDCAACGFNFLKAYGQLGEKFIEAHHLSLSLTSSPVKKES